MTPKAKKPPVGAPSPDEQPSPSFLAGCNAYRLFTLEPELERLYEQRFLGLMNYATLPFYWGGYESQEGQPARQRLTDMAAWCRNHGVVAKGHPLCWHQTCPEWLAGKSPAQVETLLWQRIDREVRAFAGLIDVWDVVNEAIVMPDRERWGDNPISQLCRRMGAVELVRQCFQAARQANPRARLILNDYDVTPAYEHLIEECLAGGVDIAAIGIQSHMHRGYWGAAKAEDVCRRFSRFGKPLHFTETTILSGALKTDDDWHGPHPGWDSTPEGEASQAAQVAEFVGILRSCPAVEAMTWWDLSDNGAWQQAPAGLLRKDMSPKPAYHELSRRFPRP